MAATNKLLIPGIAALAIVVGLAGGSLISSAAANAATTEASTTTTDGSSSSDSDASSDKSHGPHSANGVTEQVLTGDTADKVTAAAKAALPGATIERVETDAEGATYEAHVTKSDGNRVTLKFDANYKVTSTEDGMR